MVCSSCGTDNRVGRKFCSQCGSLLTAACPACGAANEPADRFCGDCGTEMPSSGGTPSAQASSVRATTKAVAERRLVSVLFADLVGFTTLSESRDAEDVRELLSEYFATARRLIGRYGGTVEKFIGDAVMAVWGAPVAQEDDAERAVRAGLDLVGAVAALGEDLHAPDLAIRAGVATGEAAVTLGAEGQGMVAGDLVNTASRVQSAASPGAVVVTEATRRATEAAIAYEDAGPYELKGKTEPVQLSRAVRVIALVGGELRSVGLESPFVGRDREFRLLKDLFHASAEDRKAHLLSVTGIGGIGKSRLSWEFFKYIDGLADNAWWHRGRCISYGDGVTYWALAEMVRMRARIVEEEEPDQAAGKLHASVLDIVPDEDDRRFIEPRLAHLLGLADLSQPTREDLFAGWRLFFEKMCERWPVVMVFEDLQWADESLLDFIEHLLEWSRNHPLFVVTLARPELLERRPTWGAGRHGSTSLSLEPLPDGAMYDLLRGMVPGLPDELVLRISSRAEGVPLYAVETVRMLLDRDLLRRDGDRFVPTGPIDELAVPETLQALISARLDGLPPEERGLVQDASVLGKTFTLTGLATVSGREEMELIPLLTSLVRKEMLNLQADARSPERGQYGFLQSLVQKVAYDTLSKRDRKAKHLAAADHLERNWSADEDEIVEVLAAHLLEAYRLAPDDPDADAIRDKARATLTRAGTRARSLAAMRLAHGYYSRAAELASDPSERATLIEHAAVSAEDAGESDEALSLLEDARALFENAGEGPASARVLARIGNTLWLTDRPAEAVDRMTAALDVLADEEPDEGLAVLAATLGKIMMFQGQDAQAMPRIEKALDVAEALWLPDVLSDALNTKGLLMGVIGRYEEELALLRRSLELALENDLVAEAARAYNNLAFSMSTRDRFDDAEAYLVSGIELAQRFGLGPQLAFFRGVLADTWFMQGRWDEIDELWREIDMAGDEPRFYGGPEVAAAAVIGVAIERGEIDKAERTLARFVGDPNVGDVQTSAHRHGLHAHVQLGQGEYRAALTSGRRALEPIETLGVRHDLVKRILPIGVEAAIAVGDLVAAREVVSVFTDASPIVLSPFERALADRYRARLSALEGSEEDVAQGFKSAAGLFRELGTPFYLACTLLDHGEWLLSQRRTDEADPLLAEAREIFESLKARPYMKRIETMSSELARA